MPLLREPRCVLVSEQDCWFIQKVLPFNFVMLNPVTHRPVFQQDTAKGATTRALRLKVNALLLRFTDEVDERGNKANSMLSLPLDYDEAWYVDGVISADSYKEAPRLIVEVTKVIYEYENGVAIGDHQVTFSQDKRFATLMDNESVKAMLAYAAKSFEGPTAVEQAERGSDDDGSDGGVS